MYSTRLSRIPQYYNGIKSMHQTVSRASYSICMQPRYDINNKWLPNRTPITLTTKRNKSFTAIAADIHAFISHSDTVAYIQDATIAYHDLTGLPWWASIITYSIGLRLLTLPLQVYTLKIHARLDSIVTKEMPAINAKVWREVNAAKAKLRLSDHGVKFRYVIEYKRELNKLILRDNCHPFKTSIVMWLQLPLWIGQSVAFRNIVTLQPDPSSIKAMIILTQLSVGGVLWIPNLVEADVSYILPVWLSLVNLANIELMALEKPGKKGRLMLAATSLFRCLSLITIPICASVPSCMAVYWCTSSTIAFIQNVLLLSPRVKRTLGIPTNTSYHMEQPYRTIAQRFSERMSQRAAWVSRVLLRRKPKK